MTPQYQCQSYYDEQNTLRDCTCGKCDPVHTFFTAPDEVKRPVYERALEKAQAEQERLLAKLTPDTNKDTNSVDVSK